MRAQGQPFLLIVLALASTAALADGVVPRWRRVPRLDCQHPAKLVGNPVAVSSVGATSVRRTMDAQFTFPGRNFSLFRMRVDDALALGQVAPTATGACYSSVLPDVRPPFGAGAASIYGQPFRGGVVFHSAMSLVDTRCAAYTRVLTPAADVRFFGPVPAVAPNQEVWLPRVDEALGEPSRLKVKRDAQSQLSFEWYSEDGRRLDYATVAGNTTFRLVREVNAEGLVDYEVAYAPPYPGNTEPGLGGDPVLADGGPKLMPDSGLAISACAGGTEPVSVLFPGSNATMRLVYKNPASFFDNGSEVRNYECVLSRVEAVSASSQARTLVSYEYALYYVPQIVQDQYVVEFTGARHESIDAGSAGWVDTWEEHQTYPPNYRELTRWRRSVAGPPAQEAHGLHFVDEQLLVDAGVTRTVVSSWDGWSVSAANQRDFSAMGTAASGDMSGFACYSGAVTPTKRPVLKWTNGTNLRTSSFYLLPKMGEDGGWNAGAGGEFGPMPARVETQCLTTHPFCGGAIEYHYGAAPTPSTQGSSETCGTTSAPTVLWATKDREGSYVVSPPTWVNSQGGQFEFRSIQRGAVDRTGTSALEQEQRSYTPLGGASRLTSVTEPSVLVSGQNAETTYQRDGNGALTGVVRGGYRRALDGSITALQHVATFYRRGTTRPCSPLQDTSGAGRVIAIEGPCFVSGPTATSCTSSGPVTELFYFGQPLPYAGLGESASDHFNSGRLAMERTYQTGCSGSYGDVHFGSYTSGGIPGKTQDANGKLHQLEFDGELVTRRAEPDGNAWEYAWDLGRLVETKLPTGERLRSCYADSFSNYPTCQTAFSTRQSKPQWTGRLRSDGSPTDYVRFTYSAESEVSLVEHFEPTGLGTHRSLSRREFTRDAEGNLRRERFGFGESWYRMSRVNAEGQQVREGEGYDFANPHIPSIYSAPEFCLGPSGQDNVCRRLQVDRLGRPTAAQRPTALGGAMATTEDCLSYDAQGNISRVARGCAQNTCTNNQVSSVQTGAGGLEVQNAPACSASPIDYIWDDFGNLTSVRRTVGGAPSEVRYTYDATGAVVAQQTQQQRNTNPSHQTILTRDARGRLTQVQESSPKTGLVTLFSQEWDFAATYFPCFSTYGRVPQNQYGRVAFESGPQWRTWFDYDPAGRLVGEFRIKQGQTGCGTLEGDGWNYTTYTYGPGGRLETIRYPFGRKVNYVYPSAPTAHSLDRPIAIQADIITSVSPWTVYTIPLVDNITWSADGKLRTYRLRHYPTKPLPWNSPAYLTTITREYGADDGTGSVEQRSPLCFRPLLPPGWQEDATGRLRRIRAYSDTYSVPFFELLHTWRADQLTAVDRCYYGQSTPVNEFQPRGAADNVRGFDAAGQLLLNAATTPTGGVAQASREWRYDTRGNRLVTAFRTVPTGGNAEGQLAQYSATGDQLTRLAAATVTGTSATELSGTRAIRTFSYDADGRLTREETPIDSYGVPNSITTFGYPYGGGVERGGFDSVIRAASVNGLTYNYFFDGRNHRTRKAYPNGAVEDFFYAPDGRLLSERSFTLDTNGTGNTVDEYVWLGEVPVFMLRSLFDGNMARLPDWGAQQNTVCQRRGEVGRCGTYFLVADHLGRPSVVLDKDFLLTGVGEFDAFGELNRVPWRAETAHPYPPNLNLTLATGVGRDKGPYTLPLRGRFSFVDTSTGYQCGQWWCPDDDRAELRDGSTVKASVMGAHQGKVVTPYFETASGTFDVRFVSNGTSQRHGVVFEGYEYQRVGAGGYRYFPPLRFPGQYFDEETGLHENWNRTYDPSTGRYLSPEPLLQSPGYMTTTASRGMQVPTYAYAANNPLRYVDRDGLDAYLVNCGGNVGHTDVYVDNACYGPESDPNRSVVGGGFYCAGFPSANALQNLQCVFAAPGEWRASPPPFTSPAAFAGRCNDPSRLQVTHIPLSCEDTAAALSRMQSVAASPPTYSAGVNNCHAVAQNIALGDGNRCLFPQNGPFRSGPMVPLYCPR